MSYKRVKIKVCDWVRPQSKQYNAEEFMQKIKEAYSYIQEADDSGSVDHCASQFQDYFIETEYISTEDGGI